MREPGLYVLFDGPPGPESGRFIEVENERGEGVNVGEWEQEGPNLWALGPYVAPTLTERELAALHLAASSASAWEELVLPRFTESEWKTLAKKLEQLK